MREVRNDALRSEEALFHATAGSAGVQALGDRVGRLAPGFEVEMILADINQPHGQPDYGVPSSLMFYARMGDVPYSVI